MGNEIGALVRRLRKERGLSQAQLAEAVNCDQAAISKIETGERVVTDIELLKRLAKSLEVPITALLDAPHPARSDASKDAGASASTNRESGPGSTDDTRQSLERLLSNTDTSEDRQVIQAALVNGHLNFVERGASNNAQTTTVDGRVIVRLEADESERMKEKLFPASPGVPPPAPSLLFIGRGKDLSMIRGLLGIGSQSGASPVIMVEGWPGVGKTSLASVLARDHEVLSSYSDGVLWTALGQNPNIFSSLGKWARALGILEVTSIATVAELTSQMHDVLRKRRMLLIVDDVWEVAHVAPFLGVLAPNSRMVITTRQPQISQGLTNTAVTTYRLPILAEEEGLKLLWALAPDVVEHDKKGCRTLVHDLERLPLALHVAGRLLRMESKLGWGVADLIEDIRNGAGILRERAPEDRAEDGQIPTVSALFRKSTDLLDEHTRDCFASLGVFAPKPATFDLAALSAVWQEENPKPFVRTLIGYGLLETVPQGRFQMHALLVAHARSLLQ